MKVLWLLAPLTSLVYTAAVQPVTNIISPQVNGSSVPLQLVNATELGIDPRFSITPYPGSDPITRISAEVNTLLLLGQLGLQDFHGQLTRTETESQPPWDDVEVSVSSVDARPLERRFAIWGLYQAVMYMIENDFTNAIFYLNYDDQRFGVLAFRLIPRNSPEAGRSDVSSPSNATTDAIPPNDTASNSSSPTTDPSLEGAITTDTKFIHGGQEISEDGIFLSLAAAIVQLASQDPFARMENDGVATTRLDAALKLRPFPRSRPPFITNADGMAAVEPTARFITEQQHSAEFTTWILAEGALIGVMSVRKSPVSPAAVDTA